MSRSYLEFEQPIVELEEKIEELKNVGIDADLNLTEEIARLRKRANELTLSIFSKLTPWQTTQMARHPQRPHTFDYIGAIFTDFEELHGDRHFSAGAALVGGIARFNGEPVMIIGHQKGRKTKEKVYRNFGMARPEAYRKAKRLMQLAEKFKLPIFTFIDTPGAYPGIGAEERNQSEAIATNLKLMSELKVPIICTVTGEGGSGGALAIGVGDRLFMLQYSIYSVISPEGCASILWKSAEKAADAANAMGITTDKLKKLELIDEIIPEPAGGVHRNFASVADNLKVRFAETLTELREPSTAQLVERRYARLMKIGEV